MKTKLLAASAFAAVVLPVSLPAAAQSGWEVSGNAGIYSDYRFRGFTQTAFRPAFQGGIDFAHSSGFYVGNWNSNVEQGLYNGASLEMDFYAGYAGSAGGLDYDVGILYYYYPTSSSGGTIDHTEIYAGVGMAGFGLKLNYAISDYFGVDSTSGTYYVQASYERDLGNGWGVAAAIGYQSLDEGRLGLDSYTDWSIGVSKEVGGWGLSAALVGTSEKDWFAPAADPGEKAGKTGLVLSVSKSF